MSSPFESPAQLRASGAGDGPSDAALAERRSRAGRWSAEAALLRACRPRQWVKNALVFAVPAAAGELTRGTVLIASVLVATVFCLVSSGTYLFNDAADVEADRLHPVKRSRPIAAGQLSVRRARIVATVVMALGLVIAGVLSWRLLAVVGAYVALTSAYTRYLKHMAVYDIAAVAAGFLLRAVAGGVASNIYISRWFLIVAGAGALFLITGKRYAELQAAGTGEGHPRGVLSVYSRDYLRAMLSTTAGVTVVAYCLWAFQGSLHERASSWTAVSAVPFVLGIMRYGLLLEQGHGEEPEEVLRGDRHLRVIGVLWLAALAAGIIS